MIYFIYDLLLFLASLVYLPFYALRGRVHRAILTRLGFFPKGFFDDLRGHEVVWIHAVSVGEARAADSLLELFRSRWPQTRIVVSTVTPTGYAILKRMIRENEIAFFAPLDISCVVNKVLNLVSPRLWMIMETELWPNLIRLAHRRATMVAVVNGRISDRSLKGYQCLRVFLRPILRRVDYFCMQTEESGERIKALGACSERVLVTGNIKFDISARLKEAPALSRLKQALPGCLLWLAGSTHDNEEEIVTTVYRALGKDFPSLRLLIAPRHLERLDKIKRMIRFAGLEPVDLSGISKISASQVVLLDTMGDLTALYGFCDVAFVGGSLVPTGGHNPLEPALFGKPILFGPHMGNFKEIRDIFIREQAALEVKDAADLEFQMRKLLASSAQRQALGECAKALLDKNRGAALRTFNAIEEKLKINDV
ncbi:MAG: 3-deoxy-D-manno-octulosonic acid transferase [Candidatus Omnitrophota bacterium]